MVKTCLHLTWTSRGTALDDSCFGCQRGGIVLIRRSEKYFSYSRHFFSDSFEVSLSTLWQMFCESTPPGEVADGSAF